MLVVDGGVASPIPTSDNGKKNKILRRVKGHSTTSIFSKLTRPLWSESSSSSPRRATIPKKSRKTSPNTQSVPRMAVVLSVLVLVVYFCSILGVMLTLEERQRQQESGGSRGGARNLSSQQQGPGAVAAEAALYHDPYHFLRAALSQKRQQQSTTISNDDIVLPESYWPMMIRDQRNKSYEETMETIPHPVDTNGTLHWVVPKFWSPPIHHGKLMSRPTAMKIGTCQVTAPVGDNNASYIRGADCPLHQRTIFVMIASYRDYQCRETVEDLYSRAMHPTRIRVGVVDQIIDGVDNPCDEPIRPCDVDPSQALCQYANFIETIPMDANTAVGPVPARHVGNRMYRGEYYALQVDAHVSFVNNWEMSLIQELEATGNEMAVLSTYLSDYVDAMDDEGNSIKTGRPIMCNSRWQFDHQAYHIHHSTQPEAPPFIHGVPTLHPWWAAGFSFSRGHFVVNVPYDLYQPMVFSGEEFAIAMRAWSVGYDLYTPEKSACFHHYAESKQGKAKRKNVPTFWEHVEQFGTGPNDPGIRGMRRLLGIVHMLNPHDGDPNEWDHTDEHIYGIGGVRRPEHLMDILGMDMMNRTTQPRLCRFVNYQGKMHRMFMPLLRSDGMGIDYRNVTYRYQYDPESTEHTDDTQERDGENDDTPSSSSSSEEEEDGADEAEENAEEAEEEAAADGEEAAADGEEAAADGEEAEAEEKDATNNEQQETENDNKGGEKNVDNAAAAVAVAAE